MGRSRNKRRERASRTRMLDLTLVRVEIARGHDGWMRGSPEPRIVLGVYRVTPDDVTLLARWVIAVRTDGPFPARIEFDRELGRRVPHAEGMRVLVLAAAIEEDDRRGVETLYADLEAPQHLAAWSVDAAVPDPKSLLEWARTAPLLAPATVRVHLVDASGDLRDRDLGDDWVGAALFHLDDAREERAERRMRFVSEDGKNDWTVVLEVRLV